MPLHPQVTAFLEVQQSLGLKPIDSCTPAEFREMMRAGRTPDDQLESVARIEDRKVDGSNGSIPLRLYHPTANEVSGAVVYYHGGGWVGGDLDTHDALCRSIANAAKCLVIATDYRLAPEYRYPTAAEDAYDSFSWACSNHRELGISPENIAVCGDSAGGNLAAVVSLMARDRNEAMPCSQILIYPIVDRDFTTSSYLQYADGYSLTSAGMKWFWDHYIPKEADSFQPYASPLKTEDLSNLPPALVITAEYDVLCEEGERYASRLLAAGVPTRQQQYRGMIHGFVSRVALFDAAREAVELIADTLRDSFRD